MAATGMEEIKAKEYVDWCENLAKVNNAYEFRNGSKNQRKFFKLQSEGYDVLYRNIWIQELDLDHPDTDF